MVAVAEVQSVASAPATLHNHISHTLKTARTANLRGPSSRHLHTLEAVPTFKNGGPLLVPHLFKLPSEVPGWEWIQGCAGKAPQDDLIPSLRAIRLALSQVSRSTLLCRHVGWQGAHSYFYHSSKRVIWSWARVFPLSLSVVYKYSLPFPFFINSLSLSLSPSLRQQVSAVQRCSQCCQLQSANVF